jgi:hypothetical protein
LGGHLDRLTTGFGEEGYVGRGSGKLVLALVLLAATGCSESPEPVGEDCFEKLLTVVDAEYLADRELVPGTEGVTPIVGRAIAEACTRVSPETPVDDAADLVVEILRTSGTQER